MLILSEVTEEKCVNERYPHTLKRKFVRPSEQQLSFCKDRRTCLYENTQVNTLMCKHIHIVR